MTGTARALAAFHAQSHDKDVSQVETLFFGPALSNGRAQPTPGQVWPSLHALEALRALDAAGPALGGSWSRVQRMLAACVEAVRVRRVSAADRYPVHRAYPSPRGLFGADLFLVPGADAPETWCLRVDPRSHALRPWGGSRVPDDLEAALEGARMAVAVDHRRYPPEYGRLRPSLALLEGGHLTATLGLTLDRAGLTPRTVFCPSDAPVPEGFTTCAVLDTGDATGGPSVSAWALARVASAASAQAAGTPLRRWLDERTSGVSAANIVTSAYIRPERAAPVTSALTAALAAAGEAAPAGGDALRLYRKVLVGDRVDVRAARELTPCGEPDEERPLPRTGDTGFPSSLGYTFAVDFLPWARAHGAGAEQVLHTLLGWTAQWGCLAAAACGLCVRPMRDYQESDWAAALGLAPDQTPAYQLWVRAERHTYMDLPVDAAR